MFEMLITERVHQCLYPYINKGNIVIDATMGNGNDTCFLAKHVGSEGTVLSFDIQREAIENTYTKLRTNMSFPDKSIYFIDEIKKISFEQGVFLIHQSHEKMEVLLSAYPLQDRKVACVMFNFGYLPGGDKKITTHVHSSINAINTSLQLIKPKGVVSLVTYPGHEEGFLEDRAIKKYLKTLPSKYYEILKLSYMNRSEKAPNQYLIYKRCCQTTDLTL